MNLGEHALYVLIVGCEVAFWVVLFAGLACRYVLRWQRVSKVLLVCVPLIDLALLAFTVVDLRNGANATFAHGLAAAYVGFTVAFGPIMIGWADRHFAHRFGNGPAPEPAPSRGWAGVLYELKLWLRCIAAVGITYVILIAMIELVGQPSKTAALYLWFRITFGTVVFWFIFGPLWNLIFFRRESTRT
jgi:hypothetical protein